MPLVVDYTEVQELKALPNGDYPATFTEFEISDSGEYPSLVATFVYRPDAPNDAATTNKKIKKWFSSKPDALVFFKNAMVALGEDPDYFKGNSAVDMELVAQNNVGNDCIIKLGNDGGKYDGSPRNEIKGFKPVNAGVAQPAAAAKSK